MRQIGDGVFYLPLGQAVNIYFIKSQDGLTLIDAGIKNSQKRIARALSTKGWTLKDIKRILITHAHPDHVGSLPELIEASGAQVYAHYLDAAVLRGQVSLQDIAPSQLGPLDKFMASISSGSQPTAEVNHELENYQFLPEIREGLKVIHLPGHTPGHIGLWMEDERFLIGGDVMMRLPWGLTMPVRAFTSNWREAKRSITKVDAMRIKKIAVGHGNPILSNAEEQVARLIRRFRS